MFVGKTFGMRTKGGTVTSTRGRFRDGPELVPAALDHDVMWGGVTPVKTVESSGFNAQPVARAKNSPLAIWSEGIPSACPAMT